LLGSRRAPSAVVVGVVVSTVLAVGIAEPVAAATPCDPPIQNPIPCENSKTGQPPSEWDVGRVGDPSIQGYATDISVNHGSTIGFKIMTDASAYRIDIYRLGYYGGLGARKVATIQPSVSLPQAQPPCLFEPSTRTVDCGNWEVSATWDVPTDAVSGVYVAKLTREDVASVGSHVLFVVRDDERHSDVLVQTSDPTWQAYNRYGGYSLYYPGASRAYKVSYNRPLDTRNCCNLGNFFSAELPMLHWLERNGYDVSYASGLDTDRYSQELLEHRMFMSVGHDEYWSAGQRAAVESARHAGVNLSFFSGNEVYWKTRWEPSLDSSRTPYRTLVCYKETYASAKIDPSSSWTGTWRDPRFSPPSDGGRPENALTGTLFTVGCCTSLEDQRYSIVVPYDDSRLRFWRNTSIASLAPGQSATLPVGTLGYEWDEDIDNGFRPPGLMSLSTTTMSVPQRIQDYGNTFSPGVATHHLTLYRDSSGAMVFGAGTVRWGWGLDDSHDDITPAPDPRMQQATVNLFADMGLQPATLQPGLVVGQRSSDATPPDAQVAGPATSVAPAGQPLTISGTAADSGGGVVGAVDVSTDGGGTWHPASGRENWTYTWTPTPGTAQIMVRATDDSANLGFASTGTLYTIVTNCPCTIWNSSAVPGTASTGDTSANELGVKFRSDVDGLVTGLRFFKSAVNTGTHTAHLWSRAGALMSQASFTNETATGWQQVSFPSPVPITANTTYVASYFAPVGGYSRDAAYFSNKGFDNAPLHALQSGVDGANGVYRFGSSGFPTSTANAANYWVDVVFVLATPAPPTPTDLTATSVSSTRIDLAWTDVSGETSYRVERSPTGTSGWSAVATTGQNVATYSDTGLSPSTTYFYRVVASNSGGDSAPSAVASATTAATSPSPPPTPTNLTATSVSSTRIDLAWTDVSGETSYRVERSPTGTSGWSAVATTGQNVATYSDTGLSPSTTYFYRVVASNSGGDSAPSAVASATTALADTTPPTSPTNLKAASAKKKVNLSWSSSTDSGGSGLSGYEVWRSADPNGPFVKLGVTASSTTSFSDGSASSNTTYWYYVIAFDGAQNHSARSNIVSGTPK
jgi:fibronectin type 3 domain-containing protein